MVEYSKNRDNVKIKAVAFDLDGTIYYGKDVITGALDAISYSRSLNLRVIFITNNSTKSRDDIKIKLNSMGIECNIDDIYTSGYATAKFIHDNKYDDVYVCGSSGLIAEFVNFGINISNRSDSKCVVIGYNQSFNYDKLTEVVNVATNADSIVACNKERTYPGLNAKIMPGCGAMVSAVEWCANKPVDYVVGKPNSYMLEIILEKYNLKNSELLVVGDTYDSDIIMAKSLCCPSILIGEGHDDTICIKSIKEIINIIIKFSGGEI